MSVLMNKNRYKFEDLTNAYVVIMGRVRVQ